MTLDKNSNEVPTPTKFIFKSFADLSKDTIIYGLGGAIGQALTLLTAPIIVRVISVGEYGSVDLINTTTTLFSILMGTNLLGGMYRYFYEIPADNEKDRKSLVSTMLWFFILFSLPLTIVASYFASNISMLIFDDLKYTQAIRLALWAIPPYMIHTFAIGLQRVLRKPQIYLALNLGYTVLYLISIVILLGVFRLNIEGVFITQLYGYSVLGLIGLWVGRKYLSFSLSWLWLKKIAFYAIPMLPGTFILWWLTSSNRFFLNTYSNSTDVGYYSLASKISSGLDIFISAFRMAWEPYAYSILNKPEAKKIYALGYKYFLILSIGLGAVFTLFSRELILIFATESYLPATMLVGIFCLRQILYGLRSTIGISISISKKTIWFTLGLVIGGVMNLISNMTLTTRFGLYGATFSEMIGFLVNFIILYYISFKLYPIPWSFSIFLKTFIGFSVIAVVNYLITQMGINVFALFGLKLVLLFIFTGYLVSLIEKDQRRDLLSFISTGFAMIRQKIARKAS